MKRCPGCGQDAPPAIFEVDLALIAKPLGSFSLAGGQMKVFAWQRLRLSHRACDWSVLGRIEDDHFIVEETDTMTIWEPEPEELRIQQPTGQPDDRSASAEEADRRDNATLVTGGLWAILGAHPTVREVLIISANQLQIRVDFMASPYTITVGQSTDPQRRVTCPNCLRLILLNVDGKLRKHVVELGVGPLDGNPNWCNASGWAPSDFIAKVGQHPDYAQEKIR